MSDEKKILLLQSLIRYRSSRRGMRELDLILARFNECSAINFNYEELCAYNEVLDMTDNEIYDFILKSDQVTKNYALIKLRDFVRTTKI